MHSSDQAEENSPLTGLKTACPESTPRERLNTERLGCPYVGTAFVQPFTGRLLSEGRPFVWEGTLFDSCSGPVQF